MASGTVPGTFASIQAAANQANYGDVITVSTSWVESGPLTLGTPGGSTPSYVIIQSSAVNSLPTETAGQPWTGRVTTGNASLMPKIQAAQQGQPALAFSRQSKWWKFRGFEILPASGVEPKFSLISIGDDTITQVIDLPDHIWIDQCYIHASPTSASYIAGMYIRDGFFCVCNRLDVTNSWIGEIKGIANSDVTECHAITLHSGSGGPFNFTNNYIEGTGHSILGGGSAPPSTSLPNIGTVPDSQGVGIRLQYNTFSKNRQWNSLDPSYVQPPLGGGIFILGTSPPSSGAYVIKVLVEFKDGENAFIDHNIFQYNWVGDQTGQALSSNVAAYALGAGYSTNYEQVRNFTVQNNVIDSVSIPFEFATNTDNNQVPNNPSNLTLSNNLCTNLSWSEAAPKPAGVRNYCMSLWSSDNVKFDHNTFISSVSGTANGAVLFAALGFSSGGGVNITNFTLTNSIVIEGANGFEVFRSSNDGGGSSSNNLTDLNKYVPSPTINKNVIYDAGTTPPAIYSGNFLVSDQTSVQLTSQTLTFPNASRTGGSITITGYFATSGPYHNAATNGTDIGVENFNNLLWQTASTQPFVTTTKITNSPITISQGSSATVNVSVSSQNGTPSGNNSVMLFLDPGPSQTTFGPLSLDNNGQATFVITNPSVGNHTLQASYGGLAGQWQPSSGNGTLTVTSSLPIPVVTVMPTTVTYPANAPITVQVSPPAGSTAVPTGKVTLTIDGNVVGQLDLNAVASGPVATTTAVSFSGITSGKATLTATVQATSGSNPPTGNATVSVFNQASTVPIVGSPFSPALSASSGAIATAVVNLVGLAPGVYSCSVSYPGQGNFQGSSAPSSSFTIPAPASPTTPPDGYSLVFDSTFNYGSPGSPLPPDPTQWGYPGYTTPDDTKDCMILPTSQQPAPYKNAFVNGSYLTIRAIKDTGQSFGSGGSTGDPYSSALIKTDKANPPQTWTYGVFDFYMAIPTVNGCHPTCWLQGALGPWPEDGEIDIGEYYDGTINSGAIWGQVANVISNNPAQGRPVGGFASGFHLYRLIWDANHLEIFWDGVSVQYIDVRNVSTPLGNPFHNAQALYLALEVGRANQIGGDATSPTFTSADFQIQYVKVYQLG